MQLQTRPVGHSGVNAEAASIEKCIPVPFVTYCKPSIIVTTRRKGLRTTSVNELGNRGGRHGDEKILEPGAAYLD